MNVKLFLVIKLDISFKRFNRRFRYCTFSAAYVHTYPYTPTPTLVRLFTRGNLLFIEVSIRFLPT